MGTCQLGERVDTSPLPYQPFKRVLLCLSGWTRVVPISGVRPFEQNSTCLTQLTSGPDVVQIWSHHGRKFDTTKPAYSTVWVPLLQYFFFFFFFTLVTGPRRSLSLRLSDTRVYEPQIRARLGTTALFGRVHYFSGHRLCMPLEEGLDLRVSVFGFEIEG